MENELEDQMGDKAGSDVELTEVRAAHAFDEQRLAAYLQAHVEGFAGPLKVRQFEGGQSNPTFQLITPARKYVLRKQPPGELLPSAHQVDREYRVMHALYTTEVPVPRMYCLCEDPSIIGTKFYVMEMVEGRLFTDSVLPTLSNDERRAIYLDLARVLAALHCVNPDSVGLSEFGRPGNYYARQISRWTKQYLASKTEADPNMDALIEWLPDNLPADTPPVIVHGDYRLGNVLIHPTEPHIVAVLDWELSTLGDALADVGYLSQDYHGESWDDDGLYQVDFAATGIPTEAEFLAEYCRHASRDGIDDWPFYLIYNMFRAACIGQGVYKRGLDGNASSAKALAYGAKGRRRAERGWAMAEAWRR